MIPLCCESQRRFWAPATLLLVITCMLVFAVQKNFGLLHTAFIPLELTHSLFHPGRQTLSALSTLVTSFFLHAGLLHLVSNMWYLCIFGSAVEQEVGFMRFTVAYIVFGTVSLVAQAAYSPLSAVPIVGASGAIAGIMGMQLILQPLRRVLMWIPPVFILRIPAFVFLLLWFYVQYASARAKPDAPIAWWAHIAGFLAGVVCGGVLRMTVVSRRRALKSKRIRAGK